MRKISFVIPCYRSQNTIETVVESIYEVMSTREDLFEIILVNDGSPDDVWSVISKLACGKSEVIGINFSQNFGQHAALMAGYAHSDGEIVVSLDDDGQTPVDEVYKLIDALSENDVVFAEYDEIKQNGFRVWGSKMNEFMTEQLVNKPKEIHPTSYFAAQRFIIEEMLRYDGPFPYIGGLIFRSTNRIANVKVTHKSRLEGRSGYNLSKLISMWLNGFTAFSVKPLRLASVLGMVSSFVGFIYGIVIIIRKIIYPQVQMGYSSMMAVMLFIGGMIMLLLGMLGEYIGRMYIGMNKKPQYVIKGVLRGNDANGM